MDASGEGAEVADARDFVIGELDAEVIFEARKQFECLQAVNSQFLEEVIIGLKFGARNFEVRGGEIQDLVGSLFKGFHKSGIKKPAPILPGNGAGVRLRQVRMRAGVFDELAQPLHHGRLRKEFAENVNLAA